METDKGKDNLILGGFKKEAGFEMKKK